MKLIILDANLFSRYISGSKYYEELSKLIAQDRVKVVMHNIILSETLSVLLKSKENKIFGRVDRQRIALDEEVRKEVFDDLMAAVKDLKVDVVAIGKGDVDRTLDKVKDVCISAFDALTLVVSDEIEPDLVAARAQPTIKCLETGQGRKGIRSALKKNSTEN